LEVESDITPIEICCVGEYVLANVVVEDGVKDVVELVEIIHTGEVS
jgi:hypothetical protein